MQGFGECLRYEDNYCDVDPHTVDAFGIPVARIHLTPRANERAMQADMAVAAAEMLEAAGARNVRHWNGMRGQAHELGAARMGNGSEDVGVQPVPADPRHQRICS